jgi:hypothetical protein
MHPGIINVLMGDGAVKGLSETVDFPTWCFINAHRDGAITQGF